MTYDLDWLEANLEDMEALTAACSLRRTSQLLNRALLTVRSERQNLESFEQFNRVQVNSPTANKQLTN